MRKMNNESKKTSKTSSKKATIIFISVVSIAILICFILSIIGTVGFSFASSTRSNLTVHRYCVIMVSSNIYDASGSESGFANGYFEIDLSSNILTYDILVAGLDTITSMHIHGPVTGSDAKTANIYLPADGSSLSTVLTDNEIFGALRLIEQQGTLIVNNPTNFYVLLNTVDYPAGAIGARLGNRCDVYRT
jgi:hypothetical protein